MKKRSSKQITIKTIKKVALKHLFDHKAYLKIVIIFVNIK